MHRWGNSGSLQLLQQGPASPTGCVFRTTMEFNVSLSFFVLEKKISPTSWGQCDMKVTADVHCMTDIGGFLKPFPLLWWPLGVTLHQRSHSRAGDGQHFLPLCLSSWPKTLFNPLHVSDDSTDRRGSFHTWVFTVSVSVFPWRRWADRGPAASERPQLWTG